jgi:fructose-bisphosphate aldolase class II
MQLMTAREDVLLTIQEAQRNQQPLFCPNAETPDEMEGLLLGASDFLSQTGRKRLVMGMGITSCYPDHPQLQRLALHNTDKPCRTLQTWLAWINTYANRNGLFEGIHIIPFLDHGWAPDPRDIQLMNDPQVQEQLGIIMFDASAYDLSENIRLTHAYVQHASKRVVVEACPDKILSEAQILAKDLSAADMLTDPQQAAAFVQQTGVDLIVPNLGTEHRATGHHVQYQAHIAAQLKQRIGSKLALHGTSSLGDRIGNIAADGIVKVNFYTAMARTASEQLLATWQTKPTDQPLPIIQACGSQVLNIRRQAVRKVALNMLCKLCTA